MSALATQPRQYLSTLTNGWRFTLPTPIRQAKDWVEGLRLWARIKGLSLVLTPADNEDSESDTECYLGAGGKVVLPAALRRRLGWKIGGRLVIVDTDEGVSITLCCDFKKCRSCFSVSGVREVIPNLYLCSECWGKYLQSAKTGQGPATEKRA